MQVVTGSVTGGVAYGGGGRGVTDGGGRGVADGGGRGVAGGTVAAEDGLADTILVRPDGHVAWAGEDVGGLRDAVERWFGSPAE